MKKILAFLVVFLGLWACKDAPEPVLTDVPLRLLESDSLALFYIAEAYETESEDYPVKWSAVDASTWKDIRLDTIEVAETGERYLCVGAITLYVPRKTVNSKSIRRLSHLKELTIFACAGTVFDEGCIPIGTESFVLDRLYSDNPEYISAGEATDKIELPEWYNVFKKKFVIHGLDAERIIFAAEIDAEVDLSGNCLNGKVPYEYMKYKNLNLSHNKFTSLQNGWDAWIDAEENAYISNNVPNLQYNSIEIPEEVLGTDFWRRHSHKFIGNPGYKAPEEL